MKFNYSELSYLLPQRLVESSLTTSFERIESKSKKMKHCLYYKKNVQLTFPVMGRAIEGKLRINQLF